MTKEQLTERNDAIRRRYRSGETMTALGREYKISRERVRQILHAGGVERRSVGRPRVQRPAVAARPARVTTEPKRVSLRGLTPPEHGLSGYANYGCKCEVCKAAKRADNLARSDARRRAKVKAA